MATLTGNKTFFIEILLCVTVLPVAAAILLIPYPENAMLFFTASSLGVAAGVLILCYRHLQMRDQKLEDAASGQGKGRYCMQRRRGYVPSVS